MDEFLARYLTELRVRALSPHTIRCYSADLRHFLGFLQRHRIKGAKGITRDRVVEYFDELRRRCPKLTSLARHASSLRAFFRWLHETERVSRPLFVPKHRQVPRKIVHVLSVAQVEALLISCSAGSGRAATDRGVRDRAILELLYSTGMRCAELCSLERNDVDLDRGIALVEGKGRRQRLLPIGEPARDAVALYVADHRPARRGVQRDFLFLSQRGTHLRSRSVQRICEAAGRRAKIPIRVHPHLLRHTFATHLVEGGADITSVSRLLGHQWLVTSQVYTHLSTHHLVDVWDKAHPHSRTAKRAPAQRLKRLPDAIAKRIAQHLVPHQEPAQVDEGELRPRAALSAPAPEPAPRRLRSARGRRVEPSGG